LGIHTNTEDMTGNIVFFTSYGGSMRAKLAAGAVRTFTHGPYVHVGVVLNPGMQVIQATSKGIVIADLPKQSYVQTDKEKAMQLYQIVDIRTKNIDEEGKAHPIDPERLKRALSWAKRHEKVTYSWWDIIDQGFDVIAPWNTVHIVQSDHFDCSNFTAAYLDQLGIPLPPQFTYPWNVSPNDLAEWAGLLPMRGRILTKKN
jgi:hypothetical protein